MKKIAFGFGVALMLCAVSLSAAPPDRQPAAAGQNDTGNGESRWNDPAFKYPYAAHSAGIELCPGIRSGVSLKWFLRDVKSRKCGFKIRGGSSKEWWVSLIRIDMNGHIFIFATESQPDSDMLAKLGKAEVKGGLTSVWKVEKDNPRQLRQVIERYMKAYPGAKYSGTTTRNESKKFTDNGINYDVKNILFVDKLESEDVEIVIESRDIEVKTAGRRSPQELQFIANATMLSMAPKMAIRVTITDKRLKAYFDALRKKSAR